MSPPFPDDTRDEPFVESPMRDNWYQSSSYFVSSFALITSVAPDGTTSIGPYQLSFPFEVAGTRSLVVISRPTSNTVSHVHRTGKCALNFIEFDRRHLQTVLNFGYPGQDPADKMRDSTFTLVDSPTPGRGAAEGCPQIVQEAYQVYECTWDEAAHLEQAIPRSTSVHLLLRLDNILLKESWKRNLDNGGERMPRVPITYGFRGGHKFWFAEVQPAFWLPVPTDRGARHESVMYEGNRLDDAVQFTADAAKELTGVPKTYLRTVLIGIVKQAKEHGVTTIDRDFVLRINRERDG